MLELRCVNFIEDYFNFVHRDQTRGGGIRKKSKIKVDFESITGLRRGKRRVKENWGDIIYG